jgi:hypothetical protein
MYRLVLFAVLMLSVYDLSAQTDSLVMVDSMAPRQHRAKSIYVEALGSSGLALSLNYDMRFKPSRKGLGIRAGITQPDRSGRSITYSFPVLLNYVNADSRVALEAGGGFIVAYRQWSYEDSNGIVYHRQGFEYPAVANLGVRFQPLKTGIVWRVYWAPAWRVGGSTQDTLLRWFGISLGVGFN